MYVKKAEKKLHIRTKIKKYGPAEDDKRNQYMKMIMLQRCYQNCWHQSAPQVDMEPLEGSSLEFTNLMSIFQQSVKKKIDDPTGRLTWLIRYIQGHPRELVNNFINDRAGCSYKNAIALFQKEYENPHSWCNVWNLEVQLRFGDCSIFWSNARQWGSVLNIIPRIHLKWYA